MSPNREAMEQKENLIPINIEEEMRRSYLDYAMSVIVGRALPDVRDGLKPVHRRVLYAMSQLGTDWNKAYKKSARVTGDVIGKYHPHGDVAVYDTIVRMAQSFSMRYPLIDGQGNFGSVDGDPPAAMRYTEIRLERFAHELLADIDKETVDFGPNYDETETQPLVLPTRIPNLLVNGSSGIAVGMATNIPPHNLTNIVDACLALIDDDSLNLDALMHFIPGPDFPTAGLINGSRGIREAYATGRGKIYMRGRVEIETNEKNNRQSIIVSELPYQVNKARLLTKIALLVKSKRIEGITGLRDESDKSGMRMVIELRRGEVPEVVINNLYQFTQLESVFGINMVALVNNQPRIFNLRELLDEFLRHRREVVTRRTIFELRKARDRAHILEGLAVALASIDPIIALIKAAANPAEAKQQLLARDWEPGPVTEMLERSGAVSSRPADLPDQFGLTAAGYRLSDTQAQAILDLRLHRLTGLEQDKIRTEYAEILDHIADLLEILKDSDRLFDVIRKELEAIRERYGDQRRTEIVHNRDDLSNEDLIAEEDVVVTLSHAGYAKAQPVSEYRAQRRGGRGKMATRTKDEDFVSRLFVANTHDTILCFSSHGKVYWLKVYQLPQAGRISRGRPLVNLLPLAEDEQVTSLLPVRGYEQGGFVVMATADGTIKKTSLGDFSRPRTAGIRAIDLNDGNNLVGVGLTTGDSDLLLVSNAGKAIRFNESDLRPMGRTARGVRGLRLKAGQRVISLITVRRDDSAGIQVLLGTENGYGKRTKLDEFAARKRGGQGVIAIQVKGRNGEVVGAQAVAQEDEIMLITDGGTLIRTRVSEISTQGRNTQGVRLIDLHEEEALVGIGKVEESGSNGDVDE
ncbi:MAG: DNA gyrase subunit A [Gammaproteobacteria bacterium]|nr:DNA gyrase subunit A [Gammaproteobacteria bacterium]